MKRISLNLPEFHGKKTNPSLSLYDLVVCFQLCIVICVSVLFPDPLNLFSIASSHFTPLSLLLPVVLLNTSYYVFSRRKILNFMPMDFAVLFFMAYLLGRNFFNPEGLVALKYAVYGIAIFYTTALLSRQRTTLSIMIYLAILLASITAISGLFEYALQDNFLHAGAIPQPPGEIHRLGSSLAHPVIYAAFLVQTIPFCILVLTKSKSYISLAFGVLTSVLTIEALFLTYTKGSLIVAIFLLIATSVVFLIKGYYKLFIPFVAILAFFIILSMIFSFETNSEISIRAPQSVSLRSGIWAGTIDAFQDNFIVGVGLRNGNSEIVKYIDNDWLRLSGIQRPPIDNYYLSLLLESGFIGFLLWMGIVGSLIWGSIKAYFLPSQDKGLIIAAFASLISISIVALTFDALLMWPHYVFFWFSAGIVRGAFIRTE